MFWSWAFRPANRGSDARTTAAAASGELIDVGGGATDGGRDPIGGGDDGAGGVAD